MTTSPLGRVVDVAEDGRYLNKHRGFLVVSAAGVEVGRVPLDDLAAVIATSAATTASCALLAELAERGIPFVLCGRNFAPAGLLWPVAGHHAQQRRMEMQIERGPALGKRLWAEVIRAKILRQGRTLARAGQRAGAFERLARLVQDGDPDNLEARAARRYWPLLMGTAFRRDPDGDAANALLNYGYAVLRAATARAIAAAGLHPGLGIFHRHPHNAMPLADDLMEPLRPLVDKRARELYLAGHDDLNTETKASLLGVLTDRVRTAEGVGPLMVHLHPMIASLVCCFRGEARQLEIPRACS